MNPIRRQLIGDLAISFALQKEVSQAARYGKEAIRILSKMPFSLRIAQLRLQTLSELLADETTDAEEFAMMFKALPLQ